MTQIKYVDEPAFFEAITPYLRECTVCDGTGEYETEFGPRDCGLCNSRLVPVITHDGKRIDMDYGDVAIVEDGQLLEVIRGVDGIKL